MYNDPFAQAADHVKTYALRVDQEPDMQINMIARTSVEGWFVVRGTNRSFARSYAVLVEESKCTVIDVIVGANMSDDELVAYAIRKNDMKL